MVEVKIYYEDTDCAGVVYHANYLRYFEWARTEYMEKKGISVKELMDRDIFLTLTSAKVDYRFPARYGDILVVDAWISETTRASFTFRYKVQEKSSQRLIVEGETKIVAVDKDQKLKRLDKGLIERLKTSV